MNRKSALVLLLVLCSSLFVQAMNEGVMASLTNLCSNIEVREVASNFQYDTQGEQKAKRSAIWFGPRMGKRGPHQDAYEEQGANALPEDLMNSVQVLLKRELDEKLGPDSSWVVYLVNDYPKYMTPRMGRELGEKCLELYRSRPPFAPRLGRTLYGTGPIRL